MQSEKYISDISNNTLNNSSNNTKSNTNKNFEDNDLYNETVIPFWINNPNILFDKQYIFEFFPIETMSYEQKLNTVTRTVLILTIIGFLFTRSFRLLLISFITIIKTRFTFITSLSINFRHNK